MINSSTDTTIKRDTRINGAASCGGEVIYSAAMGEVSGIYRKTLDKNVAEGLVMSSREFQIYKVSARGDRCAASVGNRLERHIALFNIESGAYRELTEGEVQEDYPSFSRDGGRIFFSSAGLALTPEGIPVGIGTCGIFVYHIESNEMDEMLASDKYDYIAPKEDNDGNLLFVKRPYRNAENNGNILIDIILFPVRIIKAIVGLLNFFSIAFGGESLRSGHAGRDVKTRQKSEKELFFDGNVINAQQMLKQNQRSGEKYPGIIPHSWELVRVDGSGNMSCVKKGVMDYAVCENGEVIYSNGIAIIRLLKDGGEQLLEKCSMGHNLVEVALTQAN